jgi:hypothetical protein
VANLLQFSRRGDQAQISSVDVREELENTLALIYYHLRNHPYQRGATVYAGCPHGPC